MRRADVEKLQVGQVVEASRGKYGVTFSFEVVDPTIKQINHGAHWAIKVKALAWPGGPWWGPRPGLYEAEGASGSTWHKDWKPDGRPYPGSSWDKVVPNNWGVGMELMLSTRDIRDVAADAETAKVRLEKVAEAREAEMARESQLEANYAESGRTVAAAAGAHGYSRGPGHQRQVFVQVRPTARFLQWIAEFDSEITIGIPVDGDHLLPVRKA